MMGVTPEVGLAGSSPFCDFSKAKRLNLTLRRGHAMRVHSVSFKVAECNRQPSVVRAPVMSMLNLEPR